MEPGKYNDITVVGGVSVSVSKWQMHKSVLTSSEHVTWRVSLLLNKTCSGSSRAERESQKDWRAGVEGA
jgi:hypothetical protein